MSSQELQLPCTYFPLLFTPVRNNVCETNKKSTELCCLDFFKTCCSVTLKPSLQNARHVALQGECVEDSCVLYYVVVEELV